MTDYKCYDPVTLTLLTVAAVGSIAGGFAQKASADKQAAAQEDQARLALSEAQSNADVEAHNQRIKLGTQELAFLKNGVSIDGSSSDVLKDTALWGQKSVDAILRQGTAQYNLGMTTASTTRAQGRAAVIGGFTSAAGTLGTAKIMSAKGGTPTTLGNSSTTMDNPGQ